SALERTGDFSQSYAQGPVTIYDPQNGNKPFAGNIIPQDRINPAALALLKYYPLPNFPGYTRNYSRPINTVSNQDNVNTRISNVTLSKKDRLNGGVGYQGGDQSRPNIFGFIDDTTSRGINANISWTHNFATRLINSVNYQFSRQRTLATPYFSLKQDVEG